MHLIELNELNKLNELKKINIKLFLELGLGKGPKKLNELNNFPFKTFNSFN